MSYRLRDKKERNKRLYQFWLGHQGWTYQSIGAIFHLSGQRVWEIIKREKERGNHG